MSDCRGELLYRAIIDKPGVRFPASSIRFSVPYTDDVGDDYVDDYDDVGDAGDDNTVTRCTDDANDNDAVMRRMDE